MGKSRKAASLTRFDSLVDLYMLEQGVSGISNVEDFKDASFDRY